ncbi:MAG: sigma-54-dependent Fis family transcriptional regulator [Fibrobacter sp.]|nr:sigma-54-dependent Fis family transcriptional regulator [Fibrobacter sp.]
MTYFTCSPDSAAEPCRKLLEIAAPSNIPVLIQGETGCGKEVAARSLHHWGRNPQAPFIAVNCGAISPSLLESTLFGAVKGAFTGAQQDQLGMVRAAHNGTLFLDEIGELPLEAQSRLLRTLQEKTVVPVGAHHEIPVNFRLLCATHRDLVQLQKEGLFREDLLYRISVFPIRIPPLRERAIDIPLIAQQIWRQFCTEQSSLDETLSAPEMQLIQEFPWPGNVRQLRNVLERWALLRPHGMSFSAALQNEFHLAHQANETQIRTKVQTINATQILNENPSSPQAIYRRRQARPCPQTIRRALQLHHNNRSQTARYLGISRGSLCYQLKKQGL